MNTQYLHKILLTLWLVGACGTPAALAASKEKEVKQVRQALVTMVNAIDSKDWSLAKRQFTKTVFVDYESLSGIEGQEMPSSDLVDGWQGLLAKVSTHHMLSNFEISIDKKQAEVYSHVYASHGAEDIDYWDASGRYFHKLKKQDGQWKITDMRLLLHGQKGNTHFLKDIAATQQSPKKQTHQEQEPANMRKVNFLSNGQHIVGDLYLPAQYKEGNKYPAIIVSGSWTTVKEQMSGLYAKKLAEQGMIALAFDPRNFGESEGEPRFYENPDQKTEDISSAVSFLSTLPEVNKKRIGALGICAGSMYTLMAAAKDVRIKSVVTTASWLHDSEAVKLFYGGEEGVNEKIGQAKQARKKFEETGEITYIPSISTTDPSAAMYGLYDYYLNPERGAVPQWSADKFAVMTWEAWLSLDPMPSAKEIHVPTLMIHSDGAVLPDYTKQYFKNIATQDKVLHWIETELESPYHQFSFYDQDLEVNTSVKLAGDWFQAKL